MEIQTLKEEDKQNSPILDVINVKLDVSDGIRFGFGFGLGMVIWGMIFCIITFLGVKTLLLAMSKFY